MQSVLNDDIILQYGKIMFKFSNLENILKRIIFICKHKQTFEETNDSNLTWQINECWKCSNERKLTLGSLNKKDYQNILISQSVLNEETIKKIISISKKRNEIAHNFSLISAYDLKNDISQSYRKIQSDVTKFNQIISDIQSDLNKIIGETLRELNKLEQHFENRGATFHYYNFKIEN